MPHDHDAEYDVIVVGSGAGGMTAAAVAGNLGMKSLIVEKGATVGGTTANTAGIVWLPNNAAAQAKGDSAEKARQYIKELGQHWPGSDQFESLTASSRTKFMERAPELYSFLMEQGLRVHPGKYPDCHGELTGAMMDGSRTFHCNSFDTAELGPWKKYLFVMPDSNLPTRVHRTNCYEEFRTLLGSGADDHEISKTFFNPPEDGTVRLGASLIAQLLNICRKTGHVEVRTGTEFLDLCEQDGRVVGVKIKDVEGRPHTVSSRAVFLASGGFVGDQTLREKYLPQPTNKDWTLTLPGRHTGQGLKAAMAVGAATGLMDETLGAPAIMDPMTGKLTMANFTIAKPHAIIVDQEGHRFFNESEPYFHYSSAVYEKDSHIRAPSWFIFDHQHRCKYPIGSQPRIKDPEEIPGTNARHHGIMIGIGQKSLETELDQMQAKFGHSGHNGLFIAKSISELAQQINVPVKALTTTVDAWNKMCKAGEDTHLKKGQQQRGHRGWHHFVGDSDSTINHNMGPINVGPFYATHVYPSDGGNRGGIIINEDARVVRENGGVIEGLYASGTVCANPLGRAAIAPGSPMGQAMTFGYIGMMHLASHLHK